MRAAPPSLSSGRWGTCSTCTRATRCSPPRTWAGSWATRTSSTPRSSPASRRSCTRASPWARRMRARSSASSSSMTSTSSSPRPPPCAWSAVRIPRGSTPARRTCPRCAPCSWPVSGWTRTRTRGRRTPSPPRPAVTSRSSTTGGRRRPAGRSRRTRWASSACHSSPAPPPCPCPATTCASSIPQASRFRRGRRGSSSRTCRCPRARWQPCGAMTSDSSRPTCPPSRVPTSPAIPASSTRTATCSSWGARTMSSTSQGTGSARACWRPRSPPTPPSRSARSSASTTPRRGRSPAPWSSSHPTRMPRPSAPS